MAQAVKPKEALLVRRPILVFLGALVVIASLMPAAQARTLASPLSVAPQTMTWHVTPPQHDCAASLGRPSGCAMSEGIHLIKATAHGDYYQGYLQACAVTYSTGGCNTQYWWVKDYFNYTETSTQAWNNATPACSYNHTNVAWCSYVGNGTGHLQEGFNFGKGGWARLDVVTNEIGCDFVRGPSWTNLSGWVEDEAYQTFYSCYFLQS
jgi:hypothetical protein